MKQKNKMKQAFTLIELLVVVLIIGILAAIALPKYERAVKRAQMAKIIPVLRSVYNAERALRLESGRNFANISDVSALPIEIPTVKLPGYGTGEVVLFRSCLTNDDETGCLVGMDFVLRFMSHSLYVGVVAGADGNPIFLCERAAADAGDRTCQDFGFTKPISSPREHYKATMPGDNMYTM